MVKKTVNCPDNEPEQKKFEMPSAGEHMMQVVDWWADKSDENLVIVKLEVSEEPELGRSILHRVNTDEKWKGFFTTRLFLKAIGEPYKGEGISIDSDRWVGKIFSCFIIHNKSEKNGNIYANIDTYNFDKKVEQFDAPKNEEIEWKQ